MAIKLKSVADIEKLPLDGLTQDQRTTLYDEIECWLARQTDPGVQKDGLRAMARHFEGFDAPVTDAELESWLDDMAWNDACDDECEGLPTI